MILSAVLVIGLGWQLYWSGKFDERDAKRTEQANLKSAYQSKLAQVVNLEALRKQKAEVEQRVERHRASEVQMQVGLREGVDVAGGPGRSGHALILSPSTYVPERGAASRPWGHPDFHPAPFVP